MIRTLCCVILLLVLIPSQLWSAPLTARLQAVMTTAVEPVSVIVRLKSMDARARVQGMSRQVARRTLVAELKQQATQSQGALIDFLRQQGVEDPTSLWLINGLSFSASPQLIAQIQSWPGVELISVNQTVPRPVVMPAAVSSSEWNISMIGAPQLWAQGFDGTGIVVANLDTGVDVDHPDLSANWRGGTNSWFDPYTSSTLPYDPANGDLSQGHGTAVMGVMVGGSAGGSAIGVAPGAQWIAAKIFPDSGLASNAKILEALGWILDPDGDPLTDDGADIVNNSWGFDDFLDQCLTGSQLTDYQVALDTLQTAGVGVVFSAGNTGPLSGSSIPPGNMSGILAVGAVDITKDIAFFSARGPSSCSPGENFPSLTAPGVMVLTADLTLSGTNANPYAYASGTSFAAPQVAGALALLRQAFPAKTMTELEVAVQQMAVDLGPQGDDDDYGSGLLDVTAAYNLLQDINPALDISDPTAPANDLAVDFGSVAPLSSRSLSLQLRNGGGGLLGITSVDASTLSSGFSLANDLCSGQSLAGGESCTVDLIFNPQSSTSYTSGLTIFSDDPAGPHSLALSGLGNNAPPVPSLLLPANGAVDQARPVDFSWQRDVDLDGDTVTDYLLISALGDFSDSTPITTALLPQTVMLLAGGGFLFGLCRGRDKKGWLLALILILSLLQVSCGGGGSATPASVPSAPTGEYQSTSLLPNTTYYWKIQSVDSRGGITESAVWSFTTQ